MSLKNQLTDITGKERKNFNRDDIIKIIDTLGIERLTFRYTGLDGKIKELRIPIQSKTQLEQVLAGGERVDGSSLFKGLVDSALSDLYVVPIYRTAFLNPFDSKSLDLLCRFLTNEGKPAPFAPDNILHNANKLFEKNTGLELYALGELEFYLLSDPEIDSAYALDRQKGYHASSPFVKSGEIVNEMVEYISKITGSIKYSHSEVGHIENLGSDLLEIKGKRGEQWEIEFLPMPIEEAADSLIIAKWIIRNVAKKYGCVATFAPKLEEGEAGNGLHFHMMLKKNGLNIMAGKDGKLTDEAKKLIGGLCTYADSLTAFGNTVSSAYLRLVPNQEAPTNICWSDLNRSALIRVPLGWTTFADLASFVNKVQEDTYRPDESRQTVELRSPDGSGVIYLLLAGIGMAAEWGLTQKDSLKIAEKLYVTGNIFKDKSILKKLPKLPKSCVESGRVLLRKKDLYEREGIFPDSVINYFAKKLKAEKDEFMNKQLSDLPAEDRLHETRKIMHRDIHTN